MKPTACPTPEDLSAYVLGKLSNQTLKQVAVHAAACPDCQRALQDLDTFADPLIFQLRQPRPGDPALGEPALVQFLRQAESLVAEAPPFMDFSPLRPPSGEVPPVSFDQFVKTLLDSKLMSAQEVQEVVANLSPAQPQDARRFARELVRLNKLTQYQASMLYQGKSRGFVLGNYLILDKVGAGGMGMVFRAQHRRMKRIVALKLLPPDRMKKEAAIERFQKEVEAAARLSHPNIVAAHDADQAKGVHFLIMEYVEGKDLFQLVRKQGPLPLAQAIDCVVQAAQGLEHAHAAGIVHRDIPPPNLLLDKTGTIKILDMGLAHFEEGTVPPPEGGQEPGLKGTIVGTVDYMSPEQASNPKQTDHRADIYSLGCTFYFLLTAKTVYAGESAMEKLLAHRNSPVPSLRPTRPDVPEAVDAVFQRMVAKKPEDRFQSMREVITALEACRVTGSDGRGGTQRLLAAFGEEENPWNFLDGPEAGPAEGQRTAAGLPETETEIRSLPAARKRRSARAARWRWLIQTAAVAAALLIAFSLTRLLTARGVLVLDVEGPVAGLVEEEGLKIRERHTNHHYVLKAGRYDLPAGDYEVVAPDLPARLDPDAKTFTVRRGSEVRFKVRLKEPENKLTPTQVQLKTFEARLKADNPDFDGHVTAQVEGGKVIELQFNADHVTDLAAVRALTGLKRLLCTSTPGRGRLEDLSPLNGLSLTHLHCDGSRVRDLSPLDGMPLEVLWCHQTRVEDLSPLRGTRLRELRCDYRAERDAPVLRSILSLERVNDQRAVELLATEAPRPKTFLEIVAALPAKKQVEVVAARLRELNPDFDGLVAPRIDDGKVTELALTVDEVTDVSPVRALAHLQTLECKGSGPQMGKLADLSPLRGLPLTRLSLDNTQVADLSPLEAMPLQVLNLTGTPVRELLPLAGTPLTELHLAGSRIDDLSPLKGMKLTQLSCAQTHVHDLSPLAGMPLVSLDLEGAPVASLTPLKGMGLIALNCDRTRIRDLSPLKESSLKELRCEFRPFRDGLILRSIKSLEKINGLAARTFWFRVDTNAKALDDWGQQVAKLPAPLQVQHVARKLKDLNPAFDFRQGNHQIENNKVVMLAFETDNVTDISPLRVLKGLTRLTCEGSGPGKGQLADLSPLKGMGLTFLSCRHNPQLTDLSPLRGILLTRLEGSHTGVDDLTPLKGMPLSYLGIGWTRVSDLTPARPLRLAALDCRGAPVDDLSPVKDWPLKDLKCDVKCAQDAEVLKAAKAVEKINDLRQAEFVAQVETEAKAFAAWRQGIGLLATAKQRAEAVAAKMAEKNPGFDGALKCTFEGEKITALELLVDEVTDLSPLTALPGMRKLVCSGSWPRRGKLADLSPLKGMRLNELVCASTQVRDLAPLTDMPLKHLDISSTKVGDLLPLKNMPLSWLHCDRTAVSDLSPLQGMALAELFCDRTAVNDLTVLVGMPLKILQCDLQPGRDGGVVRSLQMLETLNGKPAAGFRKP